MKIQMVEERTGPRHDGQAWPARGEVLYVEDDEGRAICEAGWAVPLPEERPVELRGAESPAEAPEPEAPAKPGINAPKAAWVTYAVACGAATEAEALVMTKTDLIAALG